ncbi:MAG: DNA-binding response regulator [Salinivirgaceae bacterium]|nr:MAG: DNA-binding response regulator [Salinivirgaceae bacterium]
MTKIKCIAVDDEPLALEQMKAFISKVNFLELTDLFGNASDALGFIKQNSVDLMFLDIEMEDLSGIEMLQSMENKPFVILTTAYDQYALQGYELQVTDYLLKPISYKRFLKAVNRVYDLLNANKNKQTNQELSSKTTTDNFIFIKTDYKLQKIEINDILFIKSMSNYLIINTIKTGAVYTLMNFKEIEELIPSEEFIRIHKSYLIPISKIDSINKSSIIIADESIPIGESYKQLLFERLKMRGLA